MVVGQGIEETPMRISYLLEGTDTWGGVKAVLEHANGLVGSHHQVIVLSRGPFPDWFPLRAEFRQVAAFSRDVIPEADCIIGTYWTTVAPAVAARRGRVVHFCQGYEGDLYDDGACIGCHRIVCLLRRRAPRFERRSKRRIVYRR
jgi:hypothetical protein